MIMPFIVINKLHFLINKIWDGKEADLIDGKTQHFSRTKYLINHEIKRLRGVKISIKDIMGQNFIPKIAEYNFPFQLKFRNKSVKLIFLTDFLCALGIMCMFQYINYSYLNLFTERRYKDAGSHEETLAIISRNIVQYRQFNFVGTILSVSYFINVLCRVIYNSKNKKKIQFDLWLYFDVIAGIVNIIAFNIVGGSSAENILNV
jgi:NADH:ubiquinone oxidoreductase subunit 4 (subunit M)